MNVWRMRTGSTQGHWVKVAMAAVAAAAGLALVHGEAHAGQLAPPAGPVGSTMKDLETVEPRIPIGPDTTPGNANSTFFINQSGSYYLTGDIAGQSGKNGIGIFAGQVTIDLNGFSLVGANDSDVGIVVLDSTGSLRIRNGALRNWLDGVATGTASEVILEEVSVTSSRRFGFILGEGDIVRNCAALFCDDDGFLTGRHCLLENCVSQDSGSQQSPAHGFLLRMGTQAVRCIALDNWDSGFHTEMECRLEACASEGNRSHGVNLSQRCSISRSTMTANSGAGLFATSDVIVTECMCSSNGEHGILVQDGGATIDSCVTSGNSLDGLFAGSDSRVTGCISNLNGFQGIWVNGRGVVTACVASGNFRNGFVGGLNASNPSGPGCIFESCIAENSGQNGFLASGGSSMRSCLAIGNAADGFRSTFSSRFMDCSSIGNAQQGFDTNGSVLEGCTTSTNGAQGFLVGTSSRLVRCISRSDQVAGFQGVQDCSFEACKATGAGNSTGTPGAGDGFIAAFDCTYVNCEATTCTGDGFESSGQVTYRNCRATENMLNGFELGLPAGANGAYVLTDCVANMNTLNGIRLASPAGGSGGSILRSSIGSENGRSGIVVGQGATLLDCRADDNGIHGIVTTGEGCRIAGCAVERNLDRGMNVTTRTKIDDCVARLNLNYGIYAESQCHITGSMVANNGDGVGSEAGIRVFEGCRIEGNAIWQNGGAGVRLDDNRNVVVRNTFMLNAGPQLNDVNANNQNALPLVGAAAAGPWDNIAH